MEEDELEDLPKANLPELPTDFNVFSSAATEDTSAYSHPPFELSPFTISSSPPPDLPADDHNESLQSSDVAAEIESDKGEAVVQVPPNRSSIPSLNETFADSELEVSIESGNIEEFELGKESGIVKDPVELEVEKLEVLNENLEASKTDETPEDFDDFCEFSNAINIPEPTAELSLEDDDDFNDFDTAIPVNRLVEAPKVAQEAQIEFVADFDAFNETPEFQDAPAQENIPREEEDDDEFGDFSDFTQAPAPSFVSPSELPVVIPRRPSNVNGLLDMMFPNAAELGESSNLGETGALKSDKFVNKFNDFDETLARGFSYSNSKASQSLVKALGIDTKNIVSKENVPKASLMIPFSLSSSAHNGRHQPHRICLVSRRI